MKERDRDQIAEILENIPIVSDGPLCDDVTSAFEKSETQSSGSFGLSSVSDGASLPAEEIKNWKVWWKDNTASQTSGLNPPKVVLPGKQARYVFIG